MIKETPAPWVVLELSSLADAELDIRKIERTILNELGNPPGVDVFIPAYTTTRRGRVTTHRYMEGYAFVRHTLDDVDYFSLESSAYVLRVFTQEVGRRRVLLTMDDGKIQDIRNKITNQFHNEVEADDRIVVTDGVYSSLSGKVVDLTSEGNDHFAWVQFDLKSLTTLVKIPTLYLRLENSDL